MASVGESRRASTRIRAEWHGVIVGGVGALPAVETRSARTFVNIQVAVAVANDHTCMCVLANEVGARAPSVGEPSSANAGIRSGGD